MKILLLFTTILLIAACTTTLPQSSYDGSSDDGAVSAGSWPVPSLGIVTDATFKVVDILRGTGAEKAGVQVGDILLELRYVAEDDPQAAEIEMQPELHAWLPFTNASAIGDLLAQTMRLEEVRREIGGPMNYVPTSGPLLLKVQRAGQIIELPLTAQSLPNVDNSAGVPTATMFPREQISF